jgi:predicted nucleic acid-binding protein
VEEVMATLIDTSLWIDFTRSRSPQRLKQFVAPYILHPDAHVAEPITFEVLRHATPEENRQLSQHFQTFPSLETPTDLWRKAASLGQACRKQGISTGSLDLLIASLAMHYQATLIAFDEDFGRIATVSSLRVKVLLRPDGTV